jgi:predicted O-methyltransferase YrrM
MQTEQAASSAHEFDQSIRKAAVEARSRLELWTNLIQSLGVRRMAEIGVYRGDFAAGVLQACPLLDRYYMLDPWRHLSDWNKPANQDDKVFEQFFAETKAKTEFAAAGRVILRGKTTEVMDQIPDGELDLAYIDADHTLRGIAIDLIRVFPKVRPGGFLGGDDFTRSIWEHNTKFEPTLVFPFAIYFAEAVGAKIYALPFAQFCLQKESSSEFSFTDLTGQYDDINLRDQFATRKVLRQAARERFPSLMRLATRARNLLPR